VSTTTIDGASAIHCVITDACHEHHGGKGSSFQEAVDRVRRQYFQCLEGWGETEGVDYHLVLTVDSPRYKQAREDAEGRCRVCNGRRELLDDAGGTWPCPACNTVVPEVPDVPAVAETPEGWDGANCPRCKGSGVRLRTGPSEPCPACGGSGEAHDYLRLLQRELDDADADAGTSGPEIETPDPRSGD